MNSAKAHLRKQLKQLAEKPVKGFHVEAMDDDLFKWRVYLAGPPGSPYEGGIFQAVMKFPEEYPFQPPTLAFTSEFWHPNVYNNGIVCISILHAPGADEFGYEDANERWSPIQSVESVLISVLYMISEPNCESPANVDASKELRDDKEDYNKKIKKIVELANKALPSDFEMPDSLKVGEEEVEKEEKHKFSEQISLIEGMGLGTPESRIAAIEKAKGDVDRACELLLEE